MKFILLLICFSSLTPAFTQSKTYSSSNGHSHNDYHHPQPFFTAYDAGLGSIEADIFLKNGSLYVAHDTADIRPERTLKALYLDPLQTIIKKNKGRVYGTTGKQLVLLIDLKTEAEPTLVALVELLNIYPELTSSPDLKLVITGKQPQASKLSSYPSFLYFDGRFDQSYDAEALKKIGMFSADFRKFSSWKGEGKMEDADQQKIREAVDRAHEWKKPVRFWAAPDSPHAWKQLMALEVDYINTDKIQELSEFLNHQQKGLKKN